MCSVTCAWPLIHAIDNSIRSEINLFTVVDNGDNAIVVTTSDQIYSIGTNGGHCPLGIGTISATLSATKLTSISNKSKILNNIKSILNSNMKTLQESLVVIMGTSWH